MSNNAEVLFLSPVLAERSGQDSPPLLYWTIYKALLAEIERDPHSVGKALPIERHISAHFGASRFTVRQALDMLEKEGYIRKQRAKPATVIARTAPVPAERTLGRLADVLQPLVVERTQVESYERSWYGPAAQQLGLRDDDDLFRLAIVHYDAKRVVGFSEIYFPAAIGERLTLDDFKAASYNGPLFVFPVVEFKTGKNVDRAKVTVGAAPASRAAGTALASLLGDTPLVRVQYLFSCAGKPVQFTTNWMDSRVYSVGYELSL